MAELAAENARPGSTTTTTTTTTTTPALNSQDASSAAALATAPVEKAPEDSSKFRTLLGILRK
jgi:hypothetical protein